MIIFILLPSNVTFLFDFSRFFSSPLVLLVTVLLVTGRDTDFKKHEQGTNTKEKKKKKYRYHSVHLLSWLHVIFARIFLETLVTAHVQLVNLVYRAICRQCIHAMSTVIEIRARGIHNFFCACAAVLCPSMVYAQNGPSIGF